MSILSNFTAILRIFRHQNYRIYCIGNSISLVGLWMQRIATGWLAWDMTGSGAWLGAIVFADLFPTVFFGPLGGAAADRWNRLRILTIGQYLAMAQATVLFVLLISGLLTIWMLLWLSIFVGVVSAFNQPARISLYPSLVPREDLGIAVATNSVIYNLARFIGPAIAGVTIVSFGIAAAFAANALSYVVFIVALSRVKITRRKDSEKKKGRLIEDLRDGFRYTLAHKGITNILILLIATGVGARPITELLPGFSAQHFNSGADGLAILTSSIGIGAVIGGIWISGKANSTSMTSFTLATSVFLAIATVLFSLTSSFWLAVPVLLVLGAMMAASGIATQTYIQLAVDGEMRGRVVSIYGLIIRGAPALGALIMGFASDYVGLSWPVVFGCLIILIVSFWVRRRLKHPL